LADATTDNGEVAIKNEDEADCAEDVSKKANTPRKRNSAAAKAANDTDDSAAKEEADDDEATPKKKAKRSTRKKTVKLESAIKADPADAGSDISV
jgi:hypothetical protein